MAKWTILYDEHQRAGGKIVDFAGWSMPLHYGSQLEEHQRVREFAGVFDVSHMTIVDIMGEQAQAFLRKLIANDVSRLTETGKALYGVMLNEHAGIIDDLIVYYCSPNHYRLIVNAGTHDKDLAWLNQHAPEFSVTIKERTDLSMLAVQGPNAREIVSQVLNQFVENIQVMELKPFYSAQSEDWMVARTGYTGEDGFEIMLPNHQAVGFWQALIKNKVQPAGLGARDTLRLEAGLNLYGVDMDETTHPLESNLAWTIAWEPTDRDFIGREALNKIRQTGVTRKLVGLVLQDRGVLRNHQTVVVPGIGEGETTSGSFSPTINKAIALARVPVETVETCAVEIRGKLVAAKVVKPPFVRHGKILV
ncbi:MAG: glycine cleavage system aminomethyltransferase GcvT [Legionellales bacterium]|nr:glycine cleavage system aminomethyltransferase GcvT [Legionellales bacterium]